MIDLPNNGRSIISWNARCLRLRVPPLFIVIISPQPTQFAPPTPIKQAVHEKYKKIIGERPNASWRFSRRSLLLLLPGPLLVLKTACNRTVPRIKSNPFPCRERSETSSESNSTALRRCVLLNLPRMTPPAATASCCDNGSTPPPIRALLR